MYVPTWDELLDDQRAIYDYPLDQPLFAAGPPGSGKTTLAIQRANLLISGGRSVALVTYNRLLRRAVVLMGGADVSASTMHEFVGSDYWRRTGTMVPTVPWDKYGHDWDALLRTLEGPPPSPKTLDHLVVDEGQDLPEGFFRYASRYVASTLSVYADENQAVGGRRTTLVQIKNASGLDDPRLLESNHRNTPEIAKVAEHFHGGKLPVAKVRRSSIADNPRITKSDAPEHTARRIANWFQIRGGTIGVIVYRNDVGSQLAAELRRLLPDGRVDLYRSNRNNENSIRLDQPGVTVLNMESAKGQEFNTLFILQLENFIPCRSDLMRRVMYMLCARARDYLWLVHGPGNLSPDAEACLPHPLLQRVV